MSINKIFQAVLFLLIFSGSALGQPYNRYWAMNKMWASGDPDFEVMNVPQKWKQESAVVLCESTFREYKKNSMGGKVNSDLYMRMRIKMLDNAAVNEYTELSFDKLTKRSFSRDGLFIGIKIVKPNGHEKIIDIDEAVQLSKYSNSNETREVDQGYNKLAIPNLEVGDIIDFYVVHINSIPMAYSGSPKRFEFEPVIRVLPGEYPILKGKLGFLPERRCYINLGVANGAPEPVLKVIDDKDYYVIEYGDLEKIESELWISPLRMYPVVRYQVIIAPPNPTEQEKHFLSEPETIKTSITEEEYIHLLKILANQVPETNSGMERKGVQYAFGKRKYSDLETLPEDLFYYFRHLLHFKSSLYYGRYTTNYNFYDRTEFAQAFSRVLLKKNIKHSVFIGVPNTVQSADDIVFMDEIIAGIRLESEEGTQYIFEPYVHDVYGEIPADMQGARIMLMDVSREHNFTFYYDTIPSSTPEVNCCKDITNLSIDSSLNGKTTIRFHSTSGRAQKARYSPIILMPQWYYPDEYNYFKQICDLSKGELKDLNETLDYLDENKEDFYDFQMEILSAHFNEVLGIEDVEIDTLIIEQMGRSNGKPEIEFIIEMETSSLLRKSQDYLILEAGKLIGKNIDLNEREKDRKLDIYMPAPRSYESKVTIKIPEGYSPQNLDDFNTSVKNETGGFTSEASQFGNLIIISVLKFYNHNYEPLSNWPLMLEFLEPANDFVQKKLVLKKL